MKVKVKENKEYFNLVKKDIDSIAKNVIKSIVDIDINTYSEI